MAHHAAGKHVPSATKGTEREVLVREFLARVFPPAYRFGSGTIIDSAGHRSGQLDVIIEFPFLPSFPTPGAPDRMYLVDSVAAVIEVKSNLTRQWKQVLKSARTVRSLVRDWRAHQSTDPKGHEHDYVSAVPHVPFFAVGFEGHTSIQKLQNLLASAEEGERPDGLFVVKSGAYSKCALSSSSRAGKGAGGLLAFSNDLAWLIRNVSWAAPRIGPYLDGLPPLDN